MNKALLFIPLIVSGVLSSAQAQNSPPLTNPNFPLDSAGVPDDRGTPGMPTSLPAPGAPGLPNESSPSSSGAIGSPSGGLGAPLNTMPSALSAPPPTSPRPDILTQPPGAGLNGGPPYR